MARIKRLTRAQKVLLSSIRNGKGSRVKPEQHEDLGVLVDHGQVYICDTNKTVHAVLSEVK